MCCSQCLNETIRPISGKRATKSLNLLPESSYKKNVVKRLMNSISDILNLNGQNFTNLITYYFKKNIEESCSIIGSVLNNEDGNIEKRALRYLKIKELLDNNNPFITDKYSMLYLKDQLMLSDDLLESI